MMETTCYQNEEKYPFLRIYDTSGIEISQNFNIEHCLIQLLKIL